MPQLQTPVQNNNTRTALFAAVVSFCAYTCIFSYRKAFNVAPYSGKVFGELELKVVLIITQVAGYMLSKFVGIRFIAALNRQKRAVLILWLTGMAWLSWLLFALIPPPYNFWCLFLNGFPLGMLWGIVFSYVEGRRATDFIGASLAVSFIFGSGIAKSVAELVMRNWGVSEYWMPFTVGAIFLLPLVFFVYLLEKIPPPDAADIAARTIRVPMNRESRIRLLRQFGPGLILLVLVYILVTILREIRDSFMADMWRESGASFQASSFTKTETIIALVILVLIALMVLLKNSFKALQVSQGIMLSGFLLAGLVTWLFREGAASMFTWITAVGLGLYMVYIPFNSNLFDRFIAAFRLSGNVGFLIYIADSFGYLGSAGVLLTKTLFRVQLNWLQFYSGLVLFSAVTGSLLTIASLIYFHKKKKPA